jgi:hypothetical protein
MEIIAGRSVSTGSQQQPTAEILVCVPQKGQIPVERQQEMSLKEMVEELPKNCDVGVKRNSKGYRETWIGYKFHIDAVDGQLPISCILSSASVHDSQVALPLAEMSARRVCNLYALRLFWTTPGVFVFI